MSSSYIDGYLGHGIILGAGYDATFKVGPHGDIKAHDSKPGDTYTGIASLAQNAYLTNDGMVYGSAAVSVTGHGGAGGIGVVMTPSGDHFSNLGGIEGGAGGASTGGGGYGNVGGTGGNGVNLVSTGSTSSNGGFILGGVGGAGSYGYAGGTGGIGLDLSGGTLNNSGSLTGGAGGGGGFGGTGGIGVTLGSGGTLNEAGLVGGGAGGMAYFGGTGATAVTVASGATLTDMNHGSVKGGSGGNSNDTSDPGAKGGAGGAAVTVASGGTVTSASGSTIYGGHGGSGYLGGAGGDGIDVAEGATFTASGLIEGGTGGDSLNADFNVSALPGAGGVGVYIESLATATLSSSALIIGGQGGGTVGGQMYATKSPAANGGAGLEAGSGSILTNFASIEGGTGGESRGNSYGGTGGVGVDLIHGIFINRGTILGGQGGYAPELAIGGAGGAGAYLNGGTLDNFAYIGGALGGDGGPVEGPGTNMRGYSGDAVDFGKNGGTLVIESTASFSGAIGQFGVGDTIDLRNMTKAQIEAHYTLGADGATIASYTNGTLSVDFIGADAGFHFSFNPDSGSGTLITLVACYLRGTRIDTDRGERPIESLALGDLVRTRSGSLRPIRWIGRRRYAHETVLADDALLPVRIRASAFATGVPRRDLWVSPDHAMYLDGVLIEARDLVNDRSITRETCGGEVSYFHLELDTHDVILAEGALSETFVDDDSRHLFDNYAEYERDHGSSPKSCAQFCAPRIEDGEVLEAVRRRLAARAQHLEAAHGAGECGEAVMAGALSAQAARPVA